jgi:hypothetical protein
MKRTGAKAHRVIEMAKRQTRSTFFEKLDANTPIAQVHNFINRMVGKKDQLEKIPTFEIDGSSIQDDEQKAEVFADLYQKHKVQTPIGHPLVCKFYGKTQHKETLISPFSMNKLKMTLDTVNTKSAPGADKIGYTWFKKAGERFHQNSLLLYNELWQKADFPRVWKQATIKPIGKKGKPQEKPSSYRTIPLLPVIGKMMEKMFQVRLEWFAEKNNLYPQSQSGFRKGMSTLDGIMCLEEVIRAALEQDKIILVLLVDYEDAYKNVTKQKKALL